MSYTARDSAAWPFGDQVATALLGLLEVELRGRGLRWRVAAPERLELHRDGAMRPGRTIDVAPLRARMARGAKADWPDLVEQAVAEWLAEAERADEAAAQAVAPWAAPLRSRLLPAQLAAATAGALARPALPGLTEVVLCETPQGGGRLLAADQAGTWAVPSAEVFAAARENVRRQGALERERLNVDGANVTVLAGPGPYCPTHVFWLCEYLERDGYAAAADHGALVVLPHRHLLAYHAIETTEAIAAAGALLRLAWRQFETAPGPLTDQLYWWREGSVTVLPVDAVGETARILPTPEFEELLSRLPGV
jgi:hypothetical protein